MSPPKIVKGQYWDVAVEDEPGSGDFTVICGLTTRNITHQVNTNDEAVRDCDKPQQVPWRVVNATSQQKDISGTGLHNRAQTGLVRSIFGKTLRYRFIEGEPGEDLVSQGYWEGPFMLSNWQEGASDGTNVTSQFTWVSDGEVPWVETTAPTLGSLTLATDTASDGVLWTSNITGAAAGSDITATASDGTVLNVSGTSVSGTFATTGSKTITLVETNAEASNSPHTSTDTVTVS